MTLDQAKAHLRVQHAGQDDEIRGFIASAVSWLDGPEGWLERSLGEQVLEGSIDHDHWLDCCRSPIRLPFPPLIEVQSIAYVDPQGAAQQMDDGDWQEIHNGSWSSYVGPAFGKSWPVVRAQPGAMTITWKAGYVDNKIPPAILAALRLLIGNQNENREQVVTGTIASNLPLGVQDLVAPFRVFS